MKKGVRIILIIAGILIILFLILFIPQQIEKQNYEKMWALFSECDAEGAMEYARKLDNASAMESAEQLQRFLALYNAGDWEAAIEMMNEKKQSFAGNTKHAAMYCNCYYQLIIPEAENALQSNDLTGAIESLLQFQHRFHNGAGNGDVYENGSYYCDFSGFKKYFPDEAEHYFDLVCNAGDAALESDDEAAIALLAGFETETGRWPRTFRPDEFSWAEPLASYEAEKSEEARKKEEEWKALTETVYDAQDLKNWNEDALEAAYGIRDIHDFTPADPQERYYIVVAKDVFDPYKNRISEGGYYDGNYVYYNQQWLPADTDDLLKEASNIKDSALTLTDDPDKAEYALILDMNYTDSVSSFTYENGYRIPVYNSVLKAELLNLATKESLQSKTVYDDPYIERKEWDGVHYATNRYIYEDVLDKADGKLYGPVPTLETDAFEGYWSFIGLEKE